MMLFLAFNIIKKRNCCGNQWYTVRRSKTMKRYKKEKT